MIASPSWQLSGFGPRGEAILTVITKRTYRFDARGRTAPSPEQLPLVGKPVFSDETDELLDDSDGYAYKPYVDVAIHGRAWADRPRREFFASAAIGAVVKRIAIFGPRRCARGPGGLVRFGPPEPVASVALSYTNAYGGHDHVTEDVRGNYLAEIGKYIPSMNARTASPYAYPRNPCGVGYVVEAFDRTFDTLKLPLLEDPDDRLTPERLVSGTPARWAAMPLPWSTGFMHIAAFPRAAYLGAVPEIDPSTLPLAEVRRGFAPRDLVRSETIFDQLNLRAVNGGSLGLQLDQVVPGERIVLEGMHAQHRRIELELPRERPVLAVDGRNGRLVETTPAIQTLRIEPDAETLSVTWRGWAPALRPYAHEELAAMPFRASWPS